MAKFAISPHFRLQDTKEVFDQSFEWIARHGIFPAGEMGAGRYEEAVVSLAL